MNSNNLEQKQRENLIIILAGATFLIFYQAFMVAPIIPKLANIFGVSAENIGLIVPAYLIPYGMITLIWGPLSDRFGRKAIILSSFICFILLTALTVTASSATSMLYIRILTGMGASGVVPISLALIGDLFPYTERGRALGWIFGAMAGGMAFGSTAGVILEPFITWRGLFLSVTILASIVLIILLPYRNFLNTKVQTGEHASIKNVISSYFSILNSGRSKQTYAYVLINAIFHSGVYTWLGLYFAKNYALSEFGIGLALIGYGLPGFLLGPVIGRLADRFGRNHLIPAGLAIAGLSTVALTINLPVYVATLFVTTLSLGYDMTQPLLAGIVTTLSPKRGAAMGLNVFTLFTGMGLGSLVFSYFLKFGINTAFIVFGTIALISAILAIYLFRLEVRPKSETNS
ncbi:MFS transporter [Clostridium saccharobutylicum]|uniref:Bacillibactin exporter n=1 Tax=Clostridium saccharobutylicum TaxID=169679 RepID=A0A1S8MP53_CLOSA|nr:MFS transporter [Clostridium saccharobutylicum]OOM05931.1 bacillibactin exporter [Clostridium saccharobutylicum]